jgi:hypothetical protein
MAEVLNYQGKLIDPLNLQDSDFDNLGMQLAVTLSRVQRFWGQCRESYSVAQHCLSLVEQAKKDSLDKNIQKWLLGHEVYEGLTGMDVPSPIKHSLAYEPYLKAEEECLIQFAVNYGLTPPVPKIVKTLDKRVMVTEAEALMPYNEKISWREMHGEPYGQLYKLGESEDEIKKDFINAWQELFGRL